MRGGEVAANKVRTTTKEYFAAAADDAVFLLGNREPDGTPVHPTDAKFKLKQ